MMDVTDAHFRALLRRISRHTVLYSEMVKDDIVLHQSTNLDFFLGQGHMVDESPSVIQLGGSEVEPLTAAAEMVSRYGNYSEINLNCG